MGYQGPSVRLVLYVDVWGKLQACHARIGALRLVSCQGGLRCLDGGRRRVVDRGVKERLGGERRGGRQEMCSFVVRWRVNR